MKPAISAGFLLASAYLCMQVDVYMQVCLHVCVGGYGGQRTKLGQHSSGNLDLFSPVSFLFSWVSGWPGI